MGLLNAYKAKITVYIEVEASSSEQAFSVAVQTADALLPGEIISFEVESLRQITDYS